MFRTGLLSIIVYTAIGICHTEILKMGKLLVYVHVHCVWIVKHAVGKILCYIKKVKIKKW